jgi:hypothetical protein
MQENLLHQTNMASDNPVCGRNQEAEIKRLNKVINALICHRFILQLKSHQGQIDETSTLVSLHRRDKRNIQPRFNYAIFLGMFKIILAIVSLR